MAVKDIRSNLKVNNSLAITLPAGGVLDSGIAIDTADYELGYMMSASIVTIIEVNDITLVAYESDDLTPANFTLITNQDQYIGDGIITVAEGAAFVGGEVEFTRGVISNKRYLVAAVDSGAGGTGAISMTVIQKGEELAEGSFVGPGTAVTLP